MKSKKNENWVKRGGLAVAIGVGLSSIASASLVLTVNNVAIADGSPGDQSLATPDRITYSTSGSGYVLDIDVATSNAPGTSTVASISLTSNIITTGAFVPGTVTIKVTDDGFTLPVSNAYTLSSSLSPTYTATGSSGTTMTFQSSANNSLAQLVQQTALQTATAGPNVTNSTSGSSTKTASLSALGTPFGLEEDATIAIGSSAHVQLVGTTSLTPEPATLGLAAMAGLGLLSRRRRQA